jgi:hypothetical protein
VSGPEPKAVDLTGCIFPWVEGAPFLCQMPGSEALYLPVFTTVEKLRAFLLRCPGGLDAGERLKKIEDGPEFFGSVPGEVVVIVDPWFTVAGTVRFTQVVAVTGSRTTTGTVESRCSCGTVLEAATPLPGTEPDAVPQPGDVTVCLDCGKAYTFAGDLGIVPLDLATLPPEDRRQVEEAQAEVRAFLHRGKA